MIPEKRRAEAQEIFNRGVIGTIAQGFVWRETFRKNTHDAETPCACFYGHQPDPRHTWRRGPLSHFRLDRLNDQSAGLSDFRYRFSAFATEHGLDDSACWMEVADA